jgi:hypothetical protein
LANRVYATMTNPTHSKPALNGRTAIYDARTNTVVVVDPRRSDMGTAFPPATGISYYHNDVK